MKSSLRTLDFIEINILICCLVALIPNSLLFKELNIKNHFSYTRSNPNLILIDSYYLENFSFLVNKPLVQEIAYNILQPLIKIKNKETLEIKSDSIEYKAFKKYLQRFKYSYRKMFLEKSFMARSKMTEKEINFLAIKSLFFLVGV
jgi:hypothetical protein